LGQRKKKWVENKLRKEKGLEHWGDEKEAFLRLSR
jgi:hypothetical protein